MEKILDLGGYNLITERDLLGIRYWAQHYTTIKPAYEVYQYLGRDNQKQLYFFKSRKDGTLLFRRFDELNMFGFRPFLLNFERIEAAYQNM